MPRPWPWCPLRPWRVQRSIISRNSPRRPLTGTITYSLMWFIPFLHVIGQVLSRYIANRKSSHRSLAASGNHAYSRGQEDAGFQEARMRGSMARLAGITMSVAVLCAAPAYVRVNQVGYSTSAAKRAYLMSSVREAGATFSVMDGSTAVFTAPIGPQLGSWSASFPHVYALDFPTTAAGTYTITVSGPAAARSPGFAIGAGSAVYAGAIGNALTFYQDERDGPDYI